MAQYRVPGTVFVLVKGKKIVYAHGYGYANLARKTPVVPDRTIFRVGPVSAVFTTAAVLQLAQQGQVRLHANVNRYLRTFKLAGTFRRPVTLADLLTNTGGFGERHIGRRTLSASGLRPLGPYLAALMPPRIEPPGSVFSYSTFGFTLAGYIVQSVARLPFARYMQRHIFRPLAMDHTTFQQRLPASLARDLATGYDVGGDGIPHAAPFEYFNVAPAAGMLATGTDIAHFMIALLQGGRYRHARILEAQTVGDMESQHFTSYPRLPGFPPLPGVAYGFGRYEQNGQVLIDQSATVRGYGALLSLLSRRHIGLFMAGNTAQTSYMFDLQRRFLDRFYPARRAPLRLPPYHPPGSSLAAFTGSYWSDEYSPNTIEKLRQLLNQVSVTAVGAATLQVHFWSGGTNRVTRVAPLLFQTGSGPALSYWAFQRDASGHVVRMIPGGNEVYDKIPWYASTAVQLELIAIFVLVFLSGSIAWLALPLARRRRPGRLQQERDGGRVVVAGWLAGLTSLLILAFLVALALAMWSAISTQNEHYSWLEYGVPPWVYALLTVPLVTTALTAPLAVLGILAWRSGYWSMLARVHYTIVLVAALAFIPFLIYWNLLGYHF